MLNSRVRHGFAAILLAVMIEKLGIPMSVPTDVLIVLAGTGADLSAPQLGLLFVALALSSTVGASELYAIVRWGGDPW